MEKFLFYCLCGAAWYLCLWAIHHALLALVVWGLNTPTPAERTPEWKMPNQIFPRGAA